MLVCEECGDKYTSYIQKRACPLEDQYLLEQDALEDGWTTTDNGIVCPECSECNICGSSLGDVVNDATGHEVRFYRRCVEYGHENFV